MPFFCLESLKDKLVFHDLSYVLKHKQLSNYYIIFLEFFPVIFFWWQIYSFPFILIYKRFKFCYSWQVSFIYSWFNADVTAYWKHFLSFYWWSLLLLFCFLSNLENLYMISNALDLFLDICDTTNEHKRKQTHYLSLVLNYFHAYFLVNQKFI